MNCIVTQCFQLSNSVLKFYWYSNVVKLNVTLRSHHSYLITNNPDSNIIFSCREWVVKYYFLLALANWIHQMWLPNFDEILDLSNHHQWLLKWLGIRLMVNFIMGKKVDNILMHWSSSSTRKEKYIDTVCFKNECPKHPHPIQRDDSCQELSWAMRPYFSHPHGRPPPAPALEDLGDGAHN